MKPINAKRSDDPMKFFTRSLYIKFNSDDEEIADQAAEQWESTVETYRAYLKRLQRHMPTDVKKLSQLSLHDAEVLASDLEPARHPTLALSFGPFPVAFLGVRHEDQIISLEYVLWKPVIISPANGSWPFSKLRKHWLYDEVDTATDDNHLFLHRILLSDGAVLVIPFFSALVRNIPLRSADHEVLRSHAAK